MKRKLLFIIATVFLVAACHNDDYMPGLPAPGTPTFFQAEDGIRDLVV